MRLPAALDGPLPALPAPLDAAARVWAGASGRLRVLLRGIVLLMCAAAATGGLVRGPWGPPTDVLVTTRAVAAGAPVTTADVAVATRPSGLVGEGALTDVVSLPPAATARGVLPPGTVVTDDHLAGDGPSGLAVEGTAVVPVDAALLPSLPVGTSLDVAVPALDGTARVVARGATVVADDGTWRWLRVARGEVDDLATGLTEGRLVPAVLPQPPAAAP